MIRWTFILLVLFYIPVVNAQTGLTSNPDNNTLLWEISGNGLSSPSYIFGTFHLVCKDDLSFSTAVKQAIINSKEVYLELDMDDPATMLGALTLLNMQGDKKLKDLYKPEDYKKIADFFKDSLNMYIAMFQRMKPGFLSAMLYPKMLGCKNSVSVEDGIMRIAKANDKEIKGLETMAMQAAVFDSIPYEKQAAELMNAIDSLETSKMHFQLLLTSYKKQQIDEIEKMIMTPEFGIELDQDILLDNRNKNWVSQLRTIMKTNPVFIAVGAGHLVGKNGLISLLRTEGYVVRGLENR